MMWTPHSPHVHVTCPPSGSRGCLPTRGGQALEECPQSILLEDKEWEEVTSSTQSFSVSWVTWSLTKSIWSLTRFTLILDKVHKLSHCPCLGECLMMLQNSKLMLSQGGILCHAKLVLEVYELRCGQRLGQHIDYLLICRYVLQSQGTFLDHLSDEMIPHVNLLQPVMEHWVV